MGDSVERAREMIETRLAEVDLERVRLEMALDLLRGVSPFEALYAESLQRPPKRARRSRRYDERVLADVLAHPGAKPVDTVSRTKIPLYNVSRTYLALEEERHIAEDAWGGYVAISHFNGG